MGEILGIGVSHFPGFVYPDHEMSSRIKLTIKSPKVPEALKTPAGWPKRMQEEWGTDEGLSTARKHREVFVRNVRQLRAAIDEFKPDFVLIFGDDQYENFKEDIVPPFCVYSFDSIDTQPFQIGRFGDPRPNVWGEPVDKVFTTKGHSQAAKHITRNLILQGFDIPYAYTTHHHKGLGHAFINTIMFLDYDRKGWNYPTIPFHVNAYGSSLIRNRGLSANLFAPSDSEADPPAPTPKRCFEVGAAVARIIKDSPWRVAIVGSSSWSHAFLTAKNHWVYPDVETDRKRLEDLKRSNYTAWRDIDPDEIVEAGEHELVNWILMAGAMHELGQKAHVLEYIESYLMNSSKCSAIIPPNGMKLRALEAATASAG